MQLDLADEMPKHTEMKNFGSLGSFIVCNSGKSLLVECCSPSEVIHVTSISAGNWFILKNIFLGVQSKRHL